MELSEFIKIRSEHYINKNYPEQESYEALAFIEIAGENISEQFAQELVQNTPIDWNEVRKNLGAMMTGIVNFCKVNHIDLRIILDENIKTMLEKKNKVVGPLLILHKEDEIFNDKPFNHD